VSGTEKSLIGLWRNFYETNPPLTPLREEIDRAWRLLRDVLFANGQVLVCGNGGSAADSEHIAGELAKPCAIARPLDPEIVEALVRTGDDGYLGEHLQGGLPVIPLVSQAALVTAIANDQGGDLIFAQQVVAYGREGDALWVLSTSGTSQNVTHALRIAKAMGLKTVAFSGPAKALIDPLCDVVVHSPGSNTPEVQHMHQLIYHAVCLAIELDRYGA
jgi:D-sedoheptulose 7-phosphate isomerase